MPRETRFERNTKRLELNFQLLYIALFFVIEAQAQCTLTTSGTYTVPYIKNYTWNNGQNIIYQDNTSTIIA
jgi:hypothetical protein